MATQDQLEYGVLLAQEIMKARMFRGDYNSHGKDFEQNLLEVGQIVARIAGHVLDADGTAFVASLTEMVRLRIRHP